MMRELAVIPLAIYLGFTLVFMKALWEDAAPWWKIVLLPPLWPALLLGILLAELFVDSL